MRLVGIPFLAMEVAVAWTLPARVSSLLFSSSSIFFWISILPLLGAILRLSVVGLKSNLSRPRAFSVFLSTRLNSSGFSRLKLNGCFRATGGLVMIRGRRKWFLDAEWSISGCIKMTSPTSPVNSTKFLHLLAASGWLQYAGSSLGSCTVEVDGTKDIETGRTPSGWSAR